MRNQRAPSGQGGLPRIPRIPRLPVGARIQARSPSSPTTARFLLPFLLPIALGLLACASGPPVPVAPGPFEPLAKGEGFFVVHVDTEVGIERLESSGGVVARDLSPGEHLWIVRMKAGHYRWSKVRFVRQTRVASSYDTRLMKVRDQREFEFEIEAGQLNYAGEIVIRVGDHLEEEVVRGVWFRNRNRSAMAIRALRKTHPDLIDALPIRYAGLRGDGFLEFYTRARASAAGKRPATRPDDARSSAGPR